MRKHGRSSIEILSDILTTTYEEGKSSKTRIMQRAYLNPKTFQKYFNFLLNQNYVTLANNDDRTVYIITNEGKNILYVLRQVNKIVSIQDKK